MKFNEETVTTAVDKNFSILMPVFYEMQTEYLASLNLIYEDLDASLVGMVLTNKLYKKNLLNNGTDDSLGFNNFYKKDQFTVPSNEIKINQISNQINIPRETVRRKRDKLIKDKILILDKKKKSISLNVDKIDKKILKLQIDNLSKFLYKFTTYFVENNYINQKITSEQIKSNINSKFLVFLTKYLDFQILYFSMFKKILDIESIFIVMLCTLNITSDLRKQNKIMDDKYILKNIKFMYDLPGLNVSSIAEITKIPRTTVIRKINKLELDGFVTRDKNKRYYTADLTKSVKGRQAMPYIDNNKKLISKFFVDCFNYLIVKK